MRKPVVWLLAAGIAIATGNIAIANDDLDQHLVLRGSHVGFTLRGDYSNATLKVSGPNGYFAQAFSKSGSLSIDLIKTGGTADGVYSYEITAATGEEVINANPQANGRGGKDPETALASAYASGTFIASGGLIAPPDSSAKE